MSYNIKNKRYKQKLRYRISQIRALGKRFKNSLNLFGKLQILKNILLIYFIKSEKYINNQYYGLYKPIKWLKMITGNQLKIFEVLAKKPFAEYTRKEIKEKSKEKSNNGLALAVNLLKKEEVLGNMKGRKFQ